MYQTIEEFDLGVQKDEDQVFLSAMSCKPDILQQIKERQTQDQCLVKMLENARSIENSDLKTDLDCVMRFRGRICVPRNEEIKKIILDEAHQTKYTLHPGGDKMYHNLKKNYWWKGMKRDVAKYVAKCFTCQQVKAEHRRPSGLLQPLKIPEWKWEDVAMDLVGTLSKNQKGEDTVWVVVDRLTKGAHFLPIRSTDPVSKLGEMYVKEIVRLHGVPKTIVSDRDSRFTSQFWQSLQKELGTKLTMSTAYHPQTDGQSERVIQILEDMLRACVLDFQGNWSKYLHLAEFAYNNSYQASIQMAPFKALYGRPCISPLCWADLEDRVLIGLELVREMNEKVKLIRKRLLTAQSRQKSYADRRRRPLEFQVGDKVFLRISPQKGIKRFGTRGKLSPRFIGPFEISRRVGENAYQLVLPISLTMVHNIFHVSMLKKYEPDPSHVLKVEEVELQPNATYEEKAVRILDRKVQSLRSKDIPLVKVLWRHHGVEEATWELENEIRIKYPELLQRTL